MGDKNPTFYHSAGNSQSFLFSIPNGMSGNTLREYPVDQLGIPTDQNMKNFVKMLDFSKSFAGKYLNLCIYLVIFILHILSLHLP
jgi:hypothetical protein